MLHVYACGDGLARLHKIYMIKDWRDISIATKIMHDTKGDQSSTFAKLAFVFPRGKKPTLQM